MYHHALIDAATGGHPAGVPQAAALLQRALRSLDRDPPLARHYLERLSQMLEARAPDPVETALLPERLAVPETGVRGGLAGWQLRRITDHIDANLHAPLATDTLAEIAQLSTGHFCRAFKASLGEPPHAYIIRQHVRRAQLLMRDTRDTLSQIACACGLSDQAHLTRLFRRLVGTTPLAWRRDWQRDA